MSTYWGNHWTWTKTKLDLLEDQIGGLNWAWAVVPPELVEKHYLCFFNVYDGGTAYTRSSTT